MITNMEVSLRNGHPQRINIIYMPTFRFIYSLYIFDGKVVIVTRESNIGIGIIGTITTPIEEKFTLIVGSVTLSRSILSKSS